MKGVTSLYFLGQDIHFRYSFYSFNFLSGQINLKQIRKQN